MTRTTVRQWFAQQAQSRADARAERLAILDAKWGLPVWAWFVLVFVVGLAVRLAGAHKAQGLYNPDEIGQYLEPAHRLLERHGIVAWEFTKGARNWIVAWYYSSVLTFARWLGFSGLQRLHFVRYNDALVSLVVIPAAFRIGRALSGRLESGILAAAMTALLPTLGYFSSCAMAEWHCLLFLTWAFAIWCENAHCPKASQDARRALLVGLLLGFAFVARPNYGLVVPLVVVDYFLRRRYRELITLLCGLAFVVAALGVVDWITWGTPFKSIIEWLSYNIIEGKGAEAHLHPFDYYFRKVLYGGYGPALFAIILAMIVSIKVTWRAVLGWFWPFLVLSFLVNKQDRFLLPIWPCFLAAAAASLVESRELLRRRFQWMKRSRVAAGLVHALPFVVLGFALKANYSATLRQPWNFKASLFKAHNWVRRQPDLTGLAVDGRWYHSGAYTVTDRHIPLIFDQKKPPSARIYSHLIAIDDSAALAKESPDWQLLRKFGRHTVFRRRDAWIGAKVGNE